MSALVVLLPLVLLLVSGSVCQSDTVDGRDFDDLRVSSDVFQGPVNYHNIVGGGETPSGQQQRAQRLTEQITNHIGKPLVPLPPTTYQQPQQQQPVKNEFSQGKKYNNPKLASSPPLPTTAKLNNNNDAITAATTTNNNNNNNNNDGGRQQQQQQPQPVSIRQASPSRSSFRLKLTPYGTCKWMTLREFKNISLDMSELIIRDADEQPCYILTMQAHLKWTEDDYFPLSNLRSLPHANKVVFGSPSDGANVRGRPLNCSLAAVAGAGAGTGGTLAATTTSQLFLPMLNQSFREEITLAGDCGYLVLHTYSDGSNLNVEAFSYYQNSDVPIQVPRAGHNQPRASSTIPLTSRINSHQIQPEFLVFSTEGTYSQLISMPLISRYICQNRIVLTGRNGVQLILDRFELQRLSYPYGEIIMSNQIEPTTLRDVGPKEPNQRIIQRRSLRVLRDLTQVRHGSPIAVVTRCPMPGSPTEPLKFMMHFNASRSNNHANGNVMGDNWAHRQQLAHAGARGFSEMFCGKLVTLNYILAVYLINLTLKHYGILDGSH